MIGTDGGLVGSADPSSFFRAKKEEGREKTRKSAQNAHAHAKARSARFCVPQRALEHIIFRRRYYSDIEEKQFYL